MKKQIPLGEAHGKGIVDVHWFFERVVVAFDEGMFSVIEARSPYPDGSLTIEDCPGVTDVNHKNFFAVPLEECGIATAEEVVELKRQQSAKYEADTKSREEAEFERLKQKLGR